MPRASIHDLQGGDRTENAEIIRGILAGDPGPRRDIVLMNASAALGSAPGARDFKEGVPWRPSRWIRAAHRKLTTLVELSQRLAADGSA